MEKIYKSIKTDVPISRTRVDEAFKLINSDLVQSLKEFFKESKHIKGISLCIAALNTEHPFEFVIRASVEVDPEYYLEGAAVCSKFGHILIELFL